MAERPSDEVMEEIEALEAIYSAECKVVSTWPVHVEIAMKPRTAEDETLQFVLATLVIRANKNYPEEPPEVMLQNTKGLGDARQAHLLRELRNQMGEMLQGGLLVATAEAAFDLLTSMNLPEGDCCFCMCPFSEDDAGGQESIRRLIKFANCFHCFHRHCCLGWFRWQLRQHEAFLADVRRPKRVEGDPNQSADDFVLQCPVCRTSVDTDDLHRLQILAAEDTSEGASELEPSDGSFANTPEDRARQAAFQQILEAQRERGGVIEERVSTPEASGGVALVHSSALWKAEEEAPAAGERQTAGEAQESVSESGRSTGTDSERTADGRGDCARAGERHLVEARAGSSGRGERSSTRGHQPGRRSPRGRGNHSQRNGGGGVGEREVAANGGGSLPGDNRRESSSGPSVRQGGRQPAGTGGRGSRPGGYSRGRGLHAEGGGRPRDWSDGLAGAASGRQSLDRRRIEPVGNERRSILGVPDVIPRGQQATGSRNGLGKLGEEADVVADGLLKARLNVEANDADTAGRNARFYNRKNSQRRGTSWVAETSQSLPPHSESTSGGERGSNHVKK